MSIKLQLSGTIMSGYNILISKEQALNSSKEKLIEELRYSIVKTMKTYNMEDLENIAKRVKLHIHCTITNDMNIIYVCTCE